MDRDIREGERDIVDRGQDPLSRHEIHELVLRQAREKAMDETKLRAVGLSSQQALDKAVYRRGKKTTDEDDPADIKVKKEERTCNLCGVRGHLARNFFFTSSQE